MAISVVQVAEGVRVRVKVIPGASRDRVMGALGDALKVAVSKPAEAGAANRAVVALLADALDVPAKQVEVVSGHAGPRKELLVSGIDLSELRRRLDALVGG